MDTTSTEAISVHLPEEVLKTFIRSSSFMKTKYNGVAPSAEELIIFYLAGVEPHEIVTNLERQVLQVSGKDLPDINDHLVQTYLEMERDKELNL